MRATTFARPLPWSNARAGARARGFALALALASAALAPPLAAQGPCRLSIETDGSPATEEAAGLLREDAERLGLCRRPWVVKLSQTSQGSYTVALWTGSDLETRSTSDANQIVPVSQLLLRVAVERAGPPPEAPAAPPAPPPSPPPQAPVAAPAPPESSTRGLVAVRAGPVWAERAGWGIGIGAEAGLEHKLLRWSLAPHAAWATDDGEGRVGVGLPFRLGFHEGNGVGAFAEIGPAWQRVGAGEAGTSAVARWGLGLGAGLSLSRRFGRGASWHLAVPVRYDVFSTDVEEVPPVEPVDPPGNGQGNGNGQGKKRDDGTSAGPFPEDRFGGLSVGLQFGVTLQLF